MANSAAPALVSSEDSTAHFVRTAGVTSRSLQGCGFLNYRPRLRSFGAALVLTLGGGGPLRSTLCGKPFHCVSAIRSRYRYAAASQRYMVLFQLALHLHFSGTEGGNLMKSTAGTVTKRMFLDIPNAAELAGFSVRHFRRIIEEERIRIVQIGRKFFILGADFERWQQTKRVKAS